MASLFGFGSSAAVRIEIQGADKERPTKTLKSDKGSEEVLIFTGQEDIRGSVYVTPSGRKLEHMGVKIELVGQIELFYDRGNHYEFTSLVRELAQPGVLTNTKTFAFEFKNNEKQFESYDGLNARLRYFVRVTLTRNYAMNITKEQDFWVENLAVAPEINNTIKMEVGIEDCLHIEFEYDKSKYHQKDIVIGKIYFLLVRIKIKHMELSIIKRESAGTGSNVYNESETMTKYEIMDGAPVRGESIPVRLFLSNINLTPTMRNVNNLFSVRYYLNLVLVDEEDRRYFKQQEIVIWRNEIF